jgi:dihydropteroate synthase
MGVINCTPDSFYSSSRVTTLEKAKQLVDRMILEGVDIIDIGGSSSKPGSTEISALEEIDRVKDTIRYITASYPDKWISIDTTKAEVGKFAVEAGCKILNDISAGEMDKQMIKTVASLKVPYVCMHMQGTPSTMQINPSYQDVVSEIIEFFQQKIRVLEDNGVSQCIIDPGFGFGKTLAHNYTLLQNLQKFTVLQRPVLAGFSRKSMIYKFLNIEPEDSLNGTTVLNTIALMKNASILRVHDVKEAKQAVELFYKTNI